MTTDGRLTSELPHILGDLAAGPYPEYIDDVLDRTQRMRQRGAWTFTGRWLPMLDIARQPVFAPRLPWRSISIALVLIALLLAAAALAVGTQPRLPAPFGLARNGLIAYDAFGDIHTGDPATGVTTAIVSGPEHDLGPRFSLDGTHVVFERQVGGGRSELYVADADGRDLTLVTPDPVLLTPSLLGEPWEQYAFSPDGQSVLIAASEGGRSGIWIARSDGTGVEQLDVGMDAFEPSFRPPDGREILFVGLSERDFGKGLYSVDLVSREVRTIAHAPSAFDLAGPTWSPDGSRIAYWSWGGDGAGLTARTHVVSADGADDRELPSPPGEVWNGGSEWSNDGTRLLVVRGYRDHFEDVRLGVIPAVGTGAGVEIRLPGTFNADCCSAWSWSPDDSEILGRPAGTDGLPLQQVILDPVKGESRAAPWTSTSDPTWQRLAP
jgi:hypothetical protein